MIYNEDTKELNLHSRFVFDKGGPPVDMNWKRLFDLFQQSLSFLVLHQGSGDNVQSSIGTGGRGLKKRTFGCQKNSYYAALNAYNNTM